MVRVASKRAGILVRRFDKPAINLRIDKADEPIEVSKEVADNLLSEPATKNIIYLVK